MAYDRLEGFIEGRKEAERQERVKEGRGKALEHLSTVVNKLQTGDNTWVEDYERAQEVIDQMPLEDPAPDDVVQRAKEEYLQARRNWLQSLGYETGDVPEEYLDQLLGLTPLKVTVAEETPFAEEPQPEPEAGEDREEEVKPEANDITEAQLEAIEVQLKLVNVVDKAVDLSRSGMSKAQAVSLLYDEQEVSKRGGVDQIISRAATNWGYYRKATWQAIFPPRMRTVTFPLGDEVLEDFKDMPKLQNALRRIGEYQFYRGMTIEDVFLASKRKSNKGE